MSYRFWLALFVLSALGMSPAAPTGGQVGDGMPGSCTESALDGKLAGGGTVTFACGGPISFFLTTAKTITQSTTIDGAGGITLDGTDSVAIFNVNPGVTLGLKNITLNQAYGGGTDGGAIKNHGTLHLEHSIIQSSRTDSTFSGGAIFSDGPVFISDSVLQDNQAGSGGALFANSGQAVVTISNSTFQRNQAINGSTGYGGAIWVGEQAQVSITVGTIISNSAQYGGGLYLSQNATVTLTSTGSPAIVSGNTAAINGGGVYNHSGRVTLTNATLSGNSAPQNGGGIYNDQAGGVATVTSSTLSGNTATASGGGIYNNLGTMLLTNSTVSGNSADDGGGLYNFLGPANLNHVTLSGNSAKFAGGLDNDLGAVNLTDVTLNGNSATQDGGGMIETLGSVTMTNSTVSGNSARLGLGGGLYNGQGTALLTNVTFSGNSAAVFGGGIYNYDGTPMLTNVTLSGNSSQGHGGGIYQYSTAVSETITLENTIVASGPSGENCYNDPTSVGVITSKGYNLTNSATCAFNQPGDLNNTNPNLGPLANNGGPTFTHLPFAPSPAIDVIPPGTNGCGTTLTTDQRGKPRPFPIGGSCDMGAVEVGWPYPRLWLAFIRR